MIPFKQGARRTNMKNILDLDLRYATLAAEGSIPSQQHKLNHFLTMENPTPPSQTEYHNTDDVIKNSYMKMFGKVKAGKAVGDMMYHTTNSGGFKKQSPAPPEKQYISYTPNNQMPHGIGLA
jgi:hypothetical protein